MTTRRDAIHLLLLLGALWLAGCSPQSSDPATFTREEQDAIDEAARAVRQNEDWAGRAEYKIQKLSDGWQVTAWRVENPDAKGNARYVPWGYRVIIIDRRGKAVEYRNSK